MKKSERLFHVLHIINRNPNTPISELAKSFQASERTIFRDLNELKKLGLAIGLNFRFPQSDVGSASRDEEFSDLEIRLIKFALNTHQLGNVFPFAKLADRIESINTNLNSARVPSGFKAPNRMTNSRNYEDIANDLDE
ncbi:MAG: HTH domain-containing protein [Candidatus Zixiibacteriota bacterium]